MNRNKNLPDSVEFQLGIFVGEYIINRYLPTISTDMLQTNKVIPVSEEDTLEFNRIDDEWYSKVSASRSGGNFSPERDAHLAFMKQLQKKYMPNELKCYVPKITISEDKLEDFKCGLAISLWDCDCCSYNTDHDKIKVEDSSRSTLITLELDNSFKLEKE